ncbi:radical SAM/SPASM domain-containing protein [Acidianus brierleyi]|uniref:Radical SAM core domain-containing protein n=1 Tax=Acidianus brierleyi TaxID=41673 RepID=A0A2U9IIE9_9CREN|nr:radical SAM protein [Acidianus brierleyi]AWR95755.1 SPASM domain-containing protein [Acidianus brierleyi]
MPKFRTKEATKLFYYLTKDIKLDFLNTSIVYITEITLNVSSDCNLACRYCFASAGHYSYSKLENMNFEDTKKAIDEIINKYNYNDSRLLVKFFGGEPILNFKLIEKVVNYFKELKENNKIKYLPKYIIITNLTLVNDKIIKFLNKNKFDIVVSLDGPENINDKARIFRNNLGTFKIIDKNLQKLIKDIDIDHITIEAVYSPIHLEQNISMLFIYKFFYNKYGIYNVAISPLTKVGQGNEFLKMFSDDLLRLYEEKIYDMAFELGRYMAYLFAEGAKIMEIYNFIKKIIINKRSLNSHCTAGFNNVTIMPNGDIYPCYMLSYDNRFYMGNIKEGLINTKTIGVRNFLKDINIKTKIDQCKMCDIMKICNACLGHIDFAKNGKITVDNYTCNYNLGLYEGILAALNDIIADDILWEKFKHQLRKMKDIEDMKDEENHLVGDI